MKSIQILKAGLLSTIQDQGRWGYLDVGVPICGAMDTLSAYIANLAVGNNRQAAVIEITQAYFQFFSLEPLIICFSGAGKAMVDGQEIQMDSPVFIPEDALVELKDTGEGSRTYLAVEGGWDVPKVLGSRSTCLVGHFGGFEGRALKEGDKLNAAKYCDSQKRLQTFIKWKNDGPVKTVGWRVAKNQFLSPSKIPVIRFIKGKEWDWFSEQTLQQFLTREFQISPQGNRIGLRIDGPKMDRKTQEELLSTAVSMGTVQVNHNGQLMVLMADAQTTGGYPRIAQIASVDLPLLAQLRPGSRFRWKEISAFEAEKLYIYWEKELTKLQTAINVQFSIKL